MTTEPESKTQNTSLKLYKELLALTELEGDAFYFKDEGKHRVFNYRLASFSDFMRPSALEARGIMFYMGESEPILVCRPFAKFFNLDENPLTMGLDLSKVKKAAVKEDGSLITSYIDLSHGGIMLKSKVSLSSQQAVMAQELLDQVSCIKLKAEVYTLTSEGFTVMFELVSPVNRIVLEYDVTELRVIGVRNLETGDLVERVDLFDEYPILTSIWVEEDILPVQEGVDFGTEFVNSIPSKTGIEGFVLTMQDGQMVKVKTEWYKNLHHLKDSIEFPGRLFEAIIHERVDDVKAMFKTDAFTINRISEMEAKVIPIFNHMIATVEKFYETNKGLGRKEYAILGQEYLKPYFNMTMALYLGRDPNYKETAIKHREEIFGIKISTTETGVNEDE